MAGTWQQGRQDKRESSGSTAVMAEDLRDWKAGVGCRAQGGHFGGQAFAVVW
jgi:hypothetical protein